MADHRSLPTGERFRRITNSSHLIDWKAYGRHWFKSGLDKQATEAVGSPVRSVSTLAVSDTNMSATKELPHPASSSPVVDFPTSSDYADKVFRRFHHHNISDSTAASNDSSPTTTCSTIDDSSATEPSPGSSPESPPPNSFKTGMFRPRTAQEQTAPFFELQKNPPPKKGRNLKNLAVNTARTPGRASSTTSLPLSQPAEPEPSIMSPSFVKPPSPPKRKPSNLGLTIRTPATLNPLPQQIKLAIPATPSFGRPGTLRHFQSSPSLPMFPILGGEVVTAPKSYQSTTLETIFSPTEGPQIQAKVDEEQNFDIPLSKEEKPEAYPDGPICVHEPYIDLYLEPTAEQARKYDVVMNVAVEVRNPLDPFAEPKSPEPEVRLDGGGGIQYAPKRDKIVEPSAQRQPSSPTTPKAFDASLRSPSREAAVDGPEYIHIPWEHNSDIVPDLLRLVKLIDERVAENKRVLVHCQCGVSRSASLVVAYGLYKDPSLSVQEAYDAVKARSKWIGPNMNFIMQLQEFRSSLARGGLLPENRGLSSITPGSALSEWHGPFSSRSTDSGPLSSTLSIGSASLQRPVPNADSLPALSPGPSSAPSGLPWPKDNTEAISRPRALSGTSPTYVDPAGHIIPSLNVIEPDRQEIKTKTITVPTFPHKEDRSATPTHVLKSPRSTEFAMAPLKPSAEVESADTFGLMSPTSTEFASSPFDRSALLAQLGMGSMHQSDHGPARTQSLRVRHSPTNSQDRSRNLGTPAGRRLRGKVSSPSIREQQELQRLQADIQARLHIEQQQQHPEQHQPLQHPTNATQPAFEGFGDALMSPRAVEFTDNPFAMTLSPPEPAPVPSPPAEAQSTTGLDPRSPAHKGVSPITRNIGDVL